MTCSCRKGAWNPECEKHGRDEKKIVYVDTNWRSLKQIFRTTFELKR